MSAQHTPGPWIVDTVASDIEVVSEDSLVTIAAVRRFAGREEANALLIAAAPDLLESLQTIVKSLADQDDEGLIEHAEPMIAARAAIAKATGGAA